MFNTIKKLKTPIMNTCINTTCIYTEYTLIKKKEIFSIINKTPISICETCSKFLYKKKD